MSGSVVIRQATAADYEAVMCIVEDVIGSDGVDCLPATYHNFLHDERHVNYVAETTDSQKVVCCSTGYFFGRFLSYMRSCVHILLHCFDAVD